MNKEYEKELAELAERLMQSECLPASIEILRQFGDKCWNEGALEAQKDAAEEIMKNYRPNNVRGLWLE